MSQPLFITFEGGEGAGKSTQVRMLQQKLLAAGHDVLLTREPGGSKGAENIRELLVAGSVDRWDVLTEALLVFAARRDHLEKTIKPALAKGQIVICDRFLDSTYAYQGVAGGLDSQIIDQLAEIVVAQTLPDLTFILDMPVDAGLARAQARDGQAIGRFEQKGVAFHQKLREGFLVRAKTNPQKYLIVDATQMIDHIADQIWQKLTELMAR